MKICYLTNDVNPKNGGGRFASDLIAGIKRAGHQVVVLKEVDDGLEGIPILKRGFGMFISALRARKYLRDCDIVHAIDVYPNAIIAVFASLGFNKKMFITALGTYSVAPLYNNYASFLSKFTFKKTAGIISISNYTKNEISKVVSDVKITVINPGIEFDKFYLPREIAEEIYLLSVGALKQRKGYHISISAFAEAKKTIPGLRYKIIGSQRDRAYFRELVELVKKAGVEKDVDFIQNVSDTDLREFYRRAKIFIMTSINHGHHFEGFGLVFLEAAAAGLPVIGTLGNGIEDAVKNGHNGLLVQQNNIRSTATAIISIMSDSQKWEDMSRASYEWAKEHDLPISIQKYLEIYNTGLK